MRKAKTFPDNPYDGHTLAAQIEQAISLSNANIKDVYADLGYRGRTVEKDNPDISIKHQGNYNRLTDKEKRLLKRRQAIEPIIGHMKPDNRMNRCHLKGAQGDALHAVLCASGYSIRWLLLMIRIKGIAFYFAFIRLLGLRRLLAKNFTPSHAVKFPPRHATIFAA